jgi:hypothetical protein
MFVRLFGVKCHKAIRRKVPEGYRMGVLIAPQGLYCRISIGPQWLDYRVRVGPDRSKAIREQGNKG